MVNYNYSEFKEITEFEFQNEINKALAFISKVEELNHEDIELVRHSIDIGYTINLTNYYGKYLTYNITKNNILIGELNCFLDNRLNFAEISTLSF